MSSEKIQIFLKNKNWWFDDVAGEYLSVLDQMGVERDSEFGEFYLHAEGIPNFVSAHGELLQVCWAALNTRYIEDTKKLQDTLGLPSSFIALDSFEGGSGYFYDRLSKGVYEVELGAKLSAIKNGCLPDWQSFSHFLEFFFEIESK